MSTKVASSGARRGGVTSFAVPEHHRDGPVNPMLVQTGISTSKSAHREEAGTKE
jgi:hypothetical protein